MTRQTKATTALAATAKSTARRFGYDIRRVDSASTMAGALARLAARADVATVVDVGASDGRWSALARHEFPEAAFLLIEAQANVYQERLEALAASVPKTHVVLAAAGDRRGEVHFDASDPFGGAAADVPFESGDAVVPVTAIDLEIERLDLPGPYLVKLDTHGFERQILAGARQTLASTTALVIEAYNFELRPGELRFHDLCAHAEELGFRPIDLVDPLRRPSDGALWQFDLVFARADDSVFEQASFHVQSPR